MLASATDPLFEDLFIDFLGIIHIFVSYRFYSLLTVIIQQKQTKVAVLCTDFLRNADPSFTPSEADTFNQGWLISLIIYINALMNRVVKSGH